MGLQHLSRKLKGGPLALSPARVIAQRLEILGSISDAPDYLVRTFCSPAMRRANEQVAAWMCEAGMAVHTDAACNIIGHYPGQKQNAPVLMLGSHLDTVPNAGKFDGPLGVVLAIACVEQLFRNGIRLPFAIEIAGFSDEEGVRFQSTYLGSRAVAGTFPLEYFNQKDASGICMADVIRQFGGNPTKLRRPAKRRFIGYAEVHIEQGPVLEQRNRSVGVVTAIAGQTRALLEFRGVAGHAGTTPMLHRKDALAAAAEFAVQVEAFARRQKALVATVGQMTVLPGASNVIPGKVSLSLDVRHALDRARKSACNRFRNLAQSIARKRGLKYSWRIVHESNAVNCSRKLSSLLANAVRAHQPSVLRLPSGAGHDAAALASIAPIAMLFVRCKGGISHHPDEFCDVKDICVAIDVMNAFLQMLAKHESA